MDIGEFVILHESAQIRFLDAISSDPILIKKIHNAYIRLADAGGNVSLRVWARMLEMAEPDEYLEIAQESELRQALLPASLKAVRSETYDRDILPIIRATEAKQTAFLGSLGNAELDSLHGLLRRFVRERGHDADSRCFECLLNSSRGS